MIEDFCTPRPPLQTFSHRRTDRQKYKVQNYLPANFANHHRHIYSRYKNVSWAHDDKRSQNLISLRACVDHREIMNINLQSRLKYLEVKYICITHIKMDPAHYWIRNTKKAMIWYIIRLIFIDFYFDLLRSYQSWGQRPSGSYLWSNRGIRMESEHICLNTSHDLFSLILYFWPPEFIDILRSATFANTKYMLNSLWTKTRKACFKTNKIWKY